MVQGAALFDLRVVLVLVLVSPAFFFSRENKREKKKFNLS